VEALLIRPASPAWAHSNDGRKLAYTSSASGRPNLWIMTWMEPERSAGDEQ